MSVHQFIQPDVVGAAEACARHILSVLEQAAAGNDQVTFAVSGGNSPRLVFEQLAKSGFNWSRVHLFLVDERVVPLTDPASNFRMLDEVFLRPAHFAHRNAHRVLTELGPERGAERYAQELRQVFGIGPEEAPRFDLIHLGMGSDGHTASLFPGDPIVQDRQHITAATFVEKMNQWRVTLMPAVLLAAHHTVVYAPGGDKAEAMKAVLDGEFDPLSYPAQIPAHLGRGVSWFMDAAAARLLG